MLVTNSARNLHSVDDVSHCRGNWPASRLGQASKAMHFAPAVMECRPLLHYAMCHSEQVPQPDTHRVSTSVPEN